MQPTERSAREILAMLEARFQPTHHYVSVSAQSFRHLDLNFYDRTANGLRAKGFRSLSDVEDTTSSFVATSNTMTASAFESPSLIDALYLSPRDDMDTIYATHTARVAAHLQQRPGVRALPIGSFDDMVASQHRMNAIKAACRGELEGVTREELERLSLLDRSIAHDVHAAIRTEQARRASEA